MQPGVHFFRRNTIIIFTEVLTNAAVGFLWDMKQKDTNRCLLRVGRVVMTYFSNHKQALAMHISLLKRWSTDTREGDNHLSLETAKII